MSLDYLTEGFEEKEWKAENLVNFYREADRHLGFCAKRSIPFPGGWS